MTYPSTLNDCSTGDLAAPGSKIQSSTAGVSTERDALRLDNNQFLADIEHALRIDICTEPAALDREPQALCEAFNKLGAEHMARSDRPTLLGLKAPMEWGGASMSSETFYQFQEMVARYSGALAFLQTQHQSAVAKLSNSDNQDLKTCYLAAAIQGQVGLGVGFSQLRRSGPPLVQATPTEGGYHITGNVPWITGYGCFQFFILGATLPDQSALFGLVPLATTTQSAGGTLTVNPPMALAAMMSTNTVTARLQQWFMPTSAILDVKPADWMQRSDRRNILNHSFFALGCARAGLDVVATATTRPQASPFIHSTWDTLDAELNQCRDQIYQAQQRVADAGGDVQIDHRLHLRAQSIDLAVRCAHAAVVVSRGAANSLDHPAQRIYREALAFSIFGQTTAIMDATLTRLSQRS